MCQLPHLGEKDPARSGDGGLQPGWSAAATGTRSRTSPSVSGKWHAATFPPGFSSSSGSSTVHTSWHFQQRVWKRQAGGGVVGLGTSPPSTWRPLCPPGDGTGTADRSAPVYGWRGCE